MPDPSAPHLPGTALPLHFGRFMLNPVTRQLLADGAPLTVGARGFDLLLLLAQRAPDAVASDELQRLVWPGRSVGGNNVRVQITALRKLLGDGVIDHQPTRGYRLVPAVSRGDDGMAAAAPPPPGNLPQTAPALYGRDAERHALCPLLAGAARVTIAGPAGAGKTVLAQALAHDRRRQHAQGVWWVDLAPLTDGAQLAERVAAAMGLALGRGDGPAGPSAMLAHALDRHEVLLVLDNAEHLVSDVSRLADDLLRHAPGVGLLVTSRRSTKCAGEQVHRLDALPLPDGPGLAAARRSGAVAVFEGRAQRADPGFALTESNVEAVVDICRRLDGLALAIVLAAARLPLLGVTGLRDRLADRWRLLASREVDARGHPQALSAALDWSYALLSSTQQALLRRLGVFAGSFALDAVQAVLGGLPAADDAPPGRVLDDWALLDALNTLLDHSLLMPEAAALEGTAPARYRLHESVRLYAADRLAAHPEAVALRARHAQHLLARVTGQPGLAGDEDPLRRRMEHLLDAADHDNLRAAIDWAAAHDLPLALRLASEANPYFRQRCHHLEARHLHTRLLAHPQVGQHPRRQARVHLALAALCFEQHELDATLVHAQAAAALLELEPHATSQGEAQGWVGAVCHGQRNFRAAEQAYRLSMAFHTAAGHVDAAADQLSNLGLVHMELGDHAQALQLLHEALALHRRQGSRWGEAIALENLGEAAYVAGDLPAAERHWQAALPLFRELGHLYHESLMLQYLGQVLRRQGRPLEARGQLRVSLSISRPQGLQGLVCDAIALLAGVYLDTGQPYRAGVLLQVSERLRVAALTGPMTVDLPAIRAGVRAALADDDWQAARAEGDRLQPDDVQA